MADDINYIDDLYRRTLRKPASEDVIALPKDYGPLQVDQSKILLEAYKQGLEPQIAQQKALEQSVGSQVKAIGEMKSPERSDLADAIMLLGAPVLGALGGEAGALSAPKAYAGASDIYERQLKAAQDKAAAQRKIGYEALKEDKKRLATLGTEIAKGRMSGGEKLADMELEKWKQQQETKRAQIMSAGQKAADTAFAKDYADFVAGGYSQGVNQIKQLKNVIEKVKQPGVTSGKIGLLPKFARDVVAPETSAVQEQVESVVQNSIRAVFGGNPTEREGIGLMERAWNPRLPEKENIKKITRFMNQLEMANEAKLQAAKYFQQHGTLQHYTGPRVDNISDFMIMLDEKEQEQGIKEKAPKSEMTREQKIKLLKSRGY